MGDFAFATMFVAVIFSSVFLIFIAMRQRSEALERQHRERMAMIERGHIPPPPPTRRGAASSLALSFGIITVGIGLGLMTIISIANSAPDVGIGIGGAIVIVGVAFIVRSIVVRPPEPEPHFRPAPPMPPEERL